MVQSKAKTVAEYLAELPPDRRRMVEDIRDIVLKNLPSGYEEGIDFGMIGYFIPLKTFPDTYNKHPLALAPARLPHECLFEPKRIGVVS